MEKIKRIQLLSTKEVADLYARPEFNTGEQELYFKLSNKSEQTAFDEYTSTRTRVYFILQLGYFKATQQFFNFNFEDAMEDAQFILRTFCEETELVLTGRISRETD